MENQKEFLNLLKRGIVSFVSEQEFLEKLNRKKILNVKVGVDPTSPDLHLGHTVVLHKLKIFQDFGHKITFIIGDFTARIGDPSGRDQTRPLLSEEQVIENAKIYQEQVFKILDKKNVDVVYNSKWLLDLFKKDLNILINNLLSRYTVQQLMERDDFTERRKENKPITLLELIYPLMQGYDSVVVKADVELGGNDQLFNLLMGRTMQKDSGQEPQVIMTFPLLVGTDGVRKMSKSYGNYIALNDSSKEMFGKIMSISDETMKVYYELLTRMDMKEVEENIKLDPKKAKIELAKHIVKFYYDEKTAIKEAEEFEKVFSKKEIPEDIPQYRPSAQESSLIQLIVESGLAPSKNEARRLINQGAVVIDGKKITYDMNIVHDKEYIIQVGKRKFCKILKK